MVTAAKTRVVRGGRPLPAELLQGGVRKHRRGTHRNKGKGKGPVCGGQGERGLCGSGNHKAGARVAGRRLAVTRAPTSRTAGRAVPARYVIVAALCAEAGGAV